MSKNNTSFFLCLLVRGTNNTTVPIESCQRSALIFIQRSKNWSTLYCLLSKTYSSFLRPPFKKHGCRQVMPKANTRRCQGKNVKADQPAVQSPPNSCEENSCDSLEEEAANSPKQPVSTENNAQEIYPWMKEFRSKGTKQSHCRSFCPKGEGEQRKWVWILNNPFALRLISARTNISKITEKQISRIFRFRTNRVQLLCVLHVKFVNCGGLAKKNSWRIDSPAWRFFIVKQFAPPFEGANRAIL